MEWTVGSPDLKPNRETYHTLRLSYNNTRLQAYAQGFYKKCPHPNMAVYERTSDDRFIYTQRNQKEIDALHAMAYASYWLMPEKLSVTAYGGLFRCFNFGQDYTHCYTSYFFTGAVTPTWATSPSMPTPTTVPLPGRGNQRLQRRRHRHEGRLQLQRLAVCLIWQQPFQHKYKMFESEVLNRNLQKTTALYSRDACNLVNLTVTWRLTKGRKFALSTAPSS